ncbi:hemin uptake protein HemP [Cognatilysobacter bugurensis]|uniref:Hemin uptake protein HemP n=1 Tax=Cognatilysobacter bugurensis TaxID=543356 RepID=A0A918T7M9_9GAMM|nr:hemin uptake protein HemP [Lysobacter bugurensis]GHA88972.1 hypothetical protein GCM10007067_28600 [Lysobacter bugurensis]
MSMPSAVLHLKPRSIDARVETTAPDVRPTRFDSRTLLRGNREILIEHAGETYRLRHTRNDKLILTK